MINNREIAEKREEYCLVTLDRNQKQECAVVHWQFSNCEKKAVGGVCQSYRFTQIVLLTKYQWE